MAFPAAAFIAAGTVLSAYGSITGGKAAGRAAEAEARAREEAAQWSRAFAGFESRRQAERDQAAIGRSLTQVAKAGVRLEGSPMAVFGENVRNAELNRLAILMEGELRARGLEAAARLSRMEGRAAQREATLDAAATLLGGATSLYGARR